MKRFKTDIVECLPLLTRSEIFLIIETEATRQQAGQISRAKQAEMEELAKKDPEMYNMICNVLENVIQEREAAETHKDQEKR